MYRQQRDYENLNKQIYKGSGEFGIPDILPEDPIDVESWVGFNYAKTCRSPEGKGVHFFLDDYQFSRVWTNVDAYIPLLRKFRVVMAPDFSTYTDFPKAIQIYNHYRKHWLAAFWQQAGIHVIPTISWSDETSYEWCFDGEPMRTTLAVSTVGTQANQEASDLFLRGYEQMMNRLEPTKVIVYGVIPKEGLPGNIIHVDSYSEKWKKRKNS